MLLGGVVLVPGCLARLLPATDAGRLQISTGLVQLETSHLQSRPAGLEGSHVCLSVYGETESLEPLDGCFEFDLRHPTDMDEDGCYILESENWLFGGFEDRGVCDGIEPDTFLMPVVKSSDVAARLWPSYDVLADHVLVDASGGRLPSDLLPSPGDPIRVVAGGQVGVVVLLDADGVSVGYDPETFETVASSDNRAVPVVLEEAYEGIGFNHVIMTPAEGEQIDVGLRLLDGEVMSAGLVVGVAPDVIESVEVAAGYDPETDRAVAVRAVMRDGNGALVHGAPVEFAASPAALVLSDGFDYASIVDCSPPPEVATERTATITATFAGLTDSAEISWVARPSVFGALPFVPPDGCPADAGASGPAGSQAADAATGCGCRGAASDVDALLLLLLLAGPCTRRRRKPC